MRSGLAGLSEDIRYLNTSCQTELNLSGKEYETISTLVGGKP
jgi:hypothetical protein